MTDEELIARLRMNGSTGAADRIAELLQKNENLMNLAIDEHTRAESLEYQLGQAKERCASASAAAYEAAAKVAMEHCYAIMSATDADARAAIIAVANRALPAVAANAEAVAPYSCPTHRSAGRHGPCPWCAEVSLQMKIIAQLVEVLEAKTVMDADSSNSTYLDAKARRVLEVAKGLKNE